MRVAEETDGCVCDWMCRVGKTFRECRVRALNAKIRVINRGECGRRSVDFQSHNQLVT